MSAPPVRTSDRRPGPVCARRVLVGTALAAAIAPAPAAGQARLAPTSRAFWWTAGAVLAGAAASDVALQRYSAEHRGPALDRLAAAGDALGRGRHLIAGLGTAYVGARLLRRPGLAAAVTHAAAAYVAGNVAVSVLKPAVGRHRPGGATGPWQLRPMSAAGSWHSFPSAHAIHAFTLAAAIAEEADNRWVSSASYGAATLVAWSCVYDEQHWASDVAAAGVLGIVASHSTLRWLHRRAPHPSGGRTLPDTRLRVVVLPSSVGVSAVW